MGRIDIFFESCNSLAYRLLEKIFELDWKPTDPEPETNRPLEKGILYGLVAHLEGRWTL